MAGVMALTVCSQVTVAQTTAPAPNMPVVPARGGGCTGIFLLCRQQHRLPVWGSVLGTGDQEQKQIERHAYPKNIAMLTPKGDAATSGTLIFRC